MYHFNFFSNAKKKQVSTQGRLFFFTTLVECFECFECGVLSGVLSEVFYTTLVFS